MKITVEVSPEDLAVMTQQIMKAAGPEAMSKIWMAIGEQIAAQMQAQMLTQIPEPFQAVFQHVLEAGIRPKTVTHCTAWRDHDKVPCQAGWRGLANVPVDWFS